MKKHIGQALIHALKETLGASVSRPSLVDSLKDYVPPRKPKVKQVKLPKEPRYEIFEPDIPLGVIIEGSMLGTIAKSKVCSP